MPRPSQIETQRKKLLPILAEAFSELGYRRATTAELAGRCKVRENILYRLWKDKKAMFIASIDYVYALATRNWTEEGIRRGSGFSAVDVLDYEAEHLGEFGHYRIIFAGLSEADDPDIRRALEKMYTSFHAFIRHSIEAHRKERNVRGGITPRLAAWAIVGLGTISTIAREINLMSPTDRKRLLRDLGRFFLANEKERR